jgi:hypothetical protein
MPNTPNTVGFGGITSLIAPDIAAQQLALQRRQMLVDLLRKQALEPMDQQVVTGAGPSRVVPISPIQGLAKMASSYLAGQDQNQIDQSNLDLNRAYAQRMAAMLSGDGQSGSPSGDASSGSPSAPDAGDGGGTGGMGAAGGTTGGFPMGGNNPAGVNLTRAMRAGIYGSLGGDAAAKAYLDQFKPTDATMDAWQGGVDPMIANRLQLIKNTTDPTVLRLRQGGMSDGQIYDAIYGQSQKDASQTMRGGNSLYTFDSSGVKLNAVAPSANDNVQFGVGSDGTVSAQPIPGVAPARRQIAGAQAGGSADESFTNVTLPDGRVVPVRGKDIPNALTGMPAPQQVDPGTFQGPPQQVLAGIADMKDPQQRANAYASYMQQLGQANRPAATPTQPPLGQSTADKLTQEANAKMMQELPQQISQTKQTITGLENAYRTVSAIDTSGPGVSRTVNALAVVNNLGLPLLKDDVNGYQTLKKYLENSAATAASANGFTGSDARFETFKAGQPNAESMTPDALKGAIRYVLSQQDAAVARGQFLQQQATQNQVNPNAVQAASQKWSQLYNPRVFEFSRMDPAERAAFKAQLAKDPAKFQQFGQEYNFAHSQGWVN